MVKKWTKILKYILWSHNATVYRRRTVLVATRLVINSESLNFLLPPQETYTPA